MKQVISYSLYGSNPRYTVGAIKNAILAMEFFPGFFVRYYVSPTVPEWVVQTLSLFRHTEIFTINRPDNNLAKFWRFAAISDPMVDVVLSRDADARLGYREALAHQEFLDSGLPFHIMRDHPTGHGYPISAGMFAVRTKAFPMWEEIFAKAQVRDTYMADQDFLRDYIWPMVADQSFSHDEYYNFDVGGASVITKIKRKRINPVCHIGAAVDENDRFVYKPDIDLSYSHSNTDKYLYDWGINENTDNR